MFAPSVGLRENKTEYDKAHRFQESRMLAKLAATLLLASAAGVPTPTTMTHVIVHYSGGDIQPGSFAEKPKTFWRSGTSFCRVEEAADSEQNLHLLIVTNEPNSWLIDLANNRMKHMVDPGPTFNCRLPIFAFSQAMATGKIGQLEFGHELEFFRSHNATQKEGPDLKSFKALYYELQIDDDAKLELVERADIQAPILIALIQGDKATTVRYSLWEDQLPFKPELFTPPTGMKVEEQQ
jgi:hypothetical protein